MFIVKATNRTNPLKRIFITEMTTQGISRIRGVGNNPTTANNIGGLLD
jgi:hypothetical protein